MKSYKQYINEITLGNKPNQAQLDAFMKEYLDNSQEHPFNGRARILGYCSVELYPFDGYIHISDILTLDKHQTGKAAKVMKYLVSLADEHKVSMTLNAKAYAQQDKYPMSTDDLYAWYKRLGFKDRPGYYGSREDGYDMIYTPK